MHTRHHYTEPGRIRRATPCRRLSNGPTGLAPLPVVTHQGGAEIRLGRPDDGPGPAQVERYLPQVAPSRTLSTAIRIRLIGATTQTDRVAAAVRTVHAVPPENGKPEPDSARCGLGLRSVVSGSPTSSPATHSTTPFLSNVRHGDTGREARGASRQRRKRRHGRFGHHGQYRLPDRHSSIFRTRTMGRAHRPGTAGTGTTRGDGGLPLPRSRDAAMGEAGSLPAIRKTGGDAGRLTGIFTGSSHQGVTGNPERSGRTAAFGGARPGRREGLEPRTVLGRQIQG